MFCNWFPSIPSYILSHIETLNICNNVSLIETPTPPDGRLAFICRPVRLNPYHLYPSNTIESVECRCVSHTHIISEFRLEIICFLNSPLCAVHPFTCSVDMLTSRSEGWFISYRLSRL